MESGGHAPGGHVTAKGDNATCIAADPTKTATTTEGKHQYHGDNRRPWGGRGYPALSVDRPASQFTQEEIGDEPVTQQK